MGSNKARDAEKAVVGHQIVVHDHHVLREGQVKLHELGELPILAAEQATDKTQSFTHAIEVIENVHTIPIQTAYEVLLEGRSLPAPYAFKEPLPTLEVQYVMMDEPDGSHTLVKHMFVGTNRPRMLTSKLLEVCHGKVYCLDIGKFNARRLVPQSVQWLLHGLGGVGLFRKSIVVPEHKKELQSDAQIDEAFDYIEENAPLGVSTNEVFRWVLKEKNNPESPVFSWSEARIEKAISNLLQGKSLCKVNTSYPLTLKDFKNWVLLDVMVDCVKHSLQHSLMFAGVSGIGPWQIKGRDWA